jgi:hypothetical protein
LTLLARRRGGSAGSKCFSPFFPRILIHLVGLDNFVRQRRAVESLGRVLLKPMSQVQQRAAMAAQFPRQLGSAGPLGDAPQRQHQFRRAAMGVVEDGVGEGIEDAAAIGALKIQDRSAVAAMHTQAVALAAPGAGQAARMEQFQQLGVTLVLVHKVGDGKIHDGWV